MTKTKADGRKDAAVSIREPRFLVAKEWMDEFHGLVQNGPLVDDTKCCHTCNQIVLQKKIQEGRDFRVVKGEAWQFIQEKFGADYKICRYLKEPAGAIRVKAERGAAARTRSSPPTAPAASEPTLDLHPEHVKLLYWDCMADKAVKATHRGCGHAVRMRHPEYRRCLAPPAICQLVRREITKHTHLGPANSEWLSPCGHVGHRLDIMVWDHVQKVWQQWRKGGWSPTTCSDDVLLSKSSSAMKLCVRKRLTSAQVEEYHHQASDARPQRQRSAEDDDGVTTVETREQARRRKRDRNETSDEEDSDTADQRQADQRQAGPRTRSRSGPREQSRVAGEPTTAAVEVDAPPDTQQTAPPQDSAGSVASEATVDTQPATATTPERSAQDLIEDMYFLFQSYMSAGRRQQSRREDV